MSGQSEAKRLSKRLSYVLRHNPASIGLVLDDAGWVELEELVDRLRVDGEADVDVVQIDLVVGAEKLSFAPTAPSGDYEDSRPKAPDQFKRSMTWLL